MTASLKGARPRSTTHRGPPAGGRNNPPWPKPSRALPGRRRLAYRQAPQSLTRLARLARLAIELGARAVEAVDRRSGGVRIRRASDEEAGCYERLKALVARMVAALGVATLFTTVAHTRESASAPPASASAPPADETHETHACVSSCVSCETCFTRRKGLAFRQTACGVEVEVPQGLDETQRTSFRVLRFVRFVNSGGGCFTRRTRRTPLVTPASRRVHPAGIGLRASRVRPIDLGLAADTLRLPEPVTLASLA